MKISNFLKLAFILIVFYLSSPVLADNINDRPLTDIACHYRMQVVSGPKAKARVNNDWYFWRKPGLIQTQDANGDHGEIWQKTATGSVQYRKLYHADKTAVEYMPADMPTNNISFDWVKLSSMLTQQELDALKPIKKVQVLGHPAELRKGITDGQALEVLWLLDENLPASIIRKDKASRVELRLIDIGPLSTAQRQPVSVEEIANYRHIDAADFGDMENDPFVKKTMAAEHRHHH